MDDNLIFTGPPLKLATREEMLAEFAGRRDLPVMALFQEERGPDNEGETSFLMRHTFEDKRGLARMLRLMADDLDKAEDGGTA